jgi:hypothetical protein
MLCKKVAYGTGVACAELNGCRRAVAFLQAPCTAVPTSTAVWHLLFMLCLTAGDAELSLWGRQRVANRHSHVPPVPPPDGQASQHAGPSSGANLGYGESLLFVFGARLLTRLELLPYSSIYAGVAANLHGPCLLEYKELSVIHHDSIFLILTCCDLLFVCSSYIHINHKLLPCCCAAGLDDQAPCACI